MSYILISVSKKMHELKKLCEIPVKGESE